MYIHCFIEKDIKTLFLFQNIGDINNIRFYGFNNTFYILIISVNH